MNIQNVAKKRAIAKSQKELREKIFPGIKESSLWNRNIKQGFATIPRTMPLFMVIMDSMSNRQPVSKVYFELLCRPFELHHVVKLNNKEEMAFHSGFTGQRAVQTWSNRIDKLAKLGFINIAPGPYGNRSFALILNPYEVIKTHRKKKTTGLTDSLYTALVARASEIKADDL